MDLNSLKEQVSNLTLYDIKAGVRKVQNGTSNSSRLFPVASTPADKCPSGNELHGNGGEGQNRCIHPWQAQLLRPEHRSAKPRTMNRTFRLLSRMWACT